MDEKKLTLDELVLELKAHVMAIRNAIEACDELGDDKYMSFTVVPNYEENNLVLRAWFNNHPDKDSNTPRINYILGYDPDDYYKWEEHI